MSLFYFQLDGRSKPTKIAKKLADADTPADWQSITLPDAWDIDFGANFDAYVYDTKQGTMTPPGNTGTPTLGSLSQRVKDQDATITDQKATIDGLTTKLGDANGTIGQLQQIAIQSTQAQAQASADTSEMKSMLVQLTQAFAQSQAPVTDTTEK